ncbi:kinesin-domain-containing protein, partial [Fistulina hepatica ATCC 64428]
QAQISALQTQQATTARDLAASKEQELVRRRELTGAADELAQLRRAHVSELSEAERAQRAAERDARAARDELRVCREDLDRERAASAQLRVALDAQSTAQLVSNSRAAALDAEIVRLRADIDARDTHAAELELELEQARKEIDTLKLEAMESETVRRQLHNMVQELKGNIRVFCRVRPDRLAAVRAQMSFPDRCDHREIVVESTGENAMGQERREVYNFAFDRVFEPECAQANVFAEVAPLATSVVDGYNVCIFAYGQTGSGKSWTMEGGATHNTAGMIPRAVEQVFRAAEALRTKGWAYEMEGQFLEIYNETINDLLAGETYQFDKKKHEIKHDHKTQQTHVTDLTVIPLNSAAHVRSLLALAQSRRSVAATLINARSSRSHSVFTLRIRGTNSATQESCYGALNLVDLAGCERLLASGTGSDKDRLRETQNINKSLSALGDVIAALGNNNPGSGEKGGHIPYRNSKLTYLLQYSLSGSSKTLMILNLSPLAAHLGESLTSLRFATKVNNTTIGTARKQL